MRPTYQADEKWNEVPGSIPNRFVQMCEGYKGE